jgi:hypothetical protein
MSEIWQPIHATHVVHGYAMQKAKPRDYEDGRLLSICDISYVRGICEKIKIKGLHSTGNRQAEGLYTTSTFPKHEHHESLISSKWENQSLNEANQGLYGHQISLCRLCPL